MSPSMRSCRFTFGFENLSEPPGDGSDLLDRGVGLDPIGPVADHGDVALHVAQLGDEAIERGTVGVRPTPLFDHQGNTQDGARLGYDDVGHLQVERQPVPLGTGACVLEDVKLWPAAAVRVTPLAAANPPLSECPP